MPFWVSSLRASLGVIWGVVWRGSWHVLAEFRAGCRRSVPLGGVCTFLAGVSQMVFAECLAGFRERPNGWGLIDGSLGVVALFLAEAHDVGST